MSEATFTFRVARSLKDEFAAAAKKRDRSGAQLLRDFMRDFIEQQQDHDAWFRREVQLGLEEANAGKLIPAEKIEAEAAAWRAELKRKLAGG